MSRAVFATIVGMDAEIACLRVKLAAARAAERERCAKACDDIAWQRADFKDPERGPSAWRSYSESDGATACATAIRALTDEGDT